MKLQVAEREVGLDESCSKERYEWERRNCLRERHEEIAAACREADRDVDGLDIVSDDFFRGMLWCFFLAVPCWLGIIYAACKFARWFW